MPRTRRNKIRKSKAGKSKIVRQRGGAAMTVGELEQVLERIEDKNAKVYCRKSDAYEDPVPALSAKFNSPANGGDPVGLVIEYYLTSEDD